MGSYDRNDILIPPMDVFRVNELPENVSMDDIGILSIEQIDRLVAKNAFVTPCDEQQLNVLQADMTQEEHQSKQDWYTGSALYTVASMLNHDENPNVAWKPFLKRIYTWPHQEMSA